MKIFILTMMIITFNISDAFEFHNRIKCINGNCTNETVITELPQIELKLSNLSKNICLLSRQNVVSRIIEVNADKIITAIEIEPYILNRYVNFFNSKEFDRNQIAVPCESISNGVIGNSEQFQACVKSNSHFKYYCDKSRLSNF